jgi:hypothetical protein
VIWAAKAVEAELATLGDRPSLEFLGKQSALGVKISRLAQLGAEVVELLVGLKSGGETRDRLVTQLEALRPVRNASVHGVSSTNRHATADDGAMVAATTAELLAIIVAIRRRE